MNIRDDSACSWTFTILIPYQGLVRYTSDAFGNILSNSGDNAYSAERYFQAREYEGHDIYYFRNRYYDSYACRFISQDPIGYQGGLNLYAFAGNDPVNYLDPLGLYRIQDILHWAREEAANPNFETQSEMFINHIWHGCWSIPRTQNKAFRSGICGDRQIYYYLDYISKSVGWTKGPEYNDWKIVGIAQEGHSFYGIKPDSHASLAVIRSIVSTNAYLYHPTDNIPKNKVIIIDLYYRTLHYGVGKWLKNGWQWYYYDLH